MSRRIALPGADELFRNTEAPVLDVPGPSHSPTPEGPARLAAVPAHDDGSDEDTAARAMVMAAAAPAAAGSAAVRTVRPARPRRKAADRRPSGREAHDEKITVYVSAEELVDLEQAKIALRSEHGLALDRGRIVREAVAIVLADLEARGEDAILVRRLRGL